MEEYFMGGVFNGWRGWAGLCTASLALAMVVPSALAQQEEALLNLYHWLDCISSGVIQS
ncbi:MAG: hypothetical protein ABIN37_10440 [Burkholderiaceae bacterium]